MGSLGRDFGTIISKRLDELGKRPFTVETEARLPADSIRNVIRAENPSGPTLSKVEQICDALGLELYIGPPRDTGPIEQITLDGTDFALVPRSDAELAAGTGAENRGEELLDYLAFRRTWLRGIGVAASDAVVARARGDSMIPTIHPGDTLLIDTARREPPAAVRSPKDTRPAPIYAFRDDVGTRVKRIERAGGNTLVLISDNPAFAPEVLDVGRAEIIGRVMWWGRTSRE